MLHQVMFSGNIKKGNSPIVKRDHAQRIVDHASQNGYNGFTVYIDGNYLTLYEGQIELIQKSIEYYADSKFYSKIMTMISRPVETHAFSGFKLCLRKIDSEDVIDIVDDCVTLTSDFFKTVLPRTTPTEYKTLLKTFARVNNMSSLEFAS